MQRIHDHVDDLATAPELNRRQIDGHLDVRAPERGFRACAVEDPGPDRDDEPGRLGDRDELGGRYPAEPRMVPAQQRLAADCPPGPRIDDRLVFKLHLAVRERELQIVFERDPAVVEARERRGIGEDLASPALLCLIEGEVRMAQQRIERHPVLRRDRVSDARAAHAVRHLHRERMRELGEDVPCGAVHVCRAGAGQHDQELVAADPGDLVARAHGGAQPVGHLLENGVAGGMAERVVDVLESIEIDRHQRQRLVGLGGLVQVPLEQIEECGAAPEVRQGVALCQRLDALERLVARHDVVKHRPADDDGADVKNGDESRQHQMHEVRPPKQREREGNACEADLPDRNEGSACVARRDARDVAHHAAADENLGLGAGVEHHGIGAAQSHEPRECPCPDQGSELPAPDRREVLGVVPRHAVEQGCA